MKSAKNTCLEIKKKCCALMASQHFDPDRLISVRSMYGPISIYFLLSIYCVAISRCNKAHFMSVELYKFAEFV